MKVYIVSDSAIVTKAFSKIKGGKEFFLEKRSGKELKKLLGSIEGGSFLYVDIGTIKEAERKKLLKSLEKLTTCSWGIIDPKGSVKDVAEYFHAGSSDYIGKDLIKAGIDAKRVKAALLFREPEFAESPVKKEKRDYLISGRDWKSIKAGNEYTFCLMFIEVDNKKDVKNLYGGDQVYEFLKIFQNYVQTAVAPIQGRIWMWQDWGGLILFPFDGETCDAILASVRLVMNRHIISAEIFDIDILISYRIVLHLGNTVYNARGETGKIISDAINSIYHLGQKFADNSNFYLTKDVADFVPKGLEKLFLPAGEYEGREILRMRLPILTVYK